MTLREAAPMEESRARMLNPLQLAYIGDGANYTANGDATLYAVWGKNSTVTYNANGGSGAPEAQTKTYGEDLKLSSTVPTTGIT